ncbi:MAG: glycosyl hydrolase [bacterium]|nr:glycosyl hydrolase [bacterium]
MLQKDNALGINNEATVLDAYSQTIPLDYKQSYFSNEKQINYSFSWQTQNKKPPLMLSLPHHRTSLLPSTSVMYSGIKGLMLGETSTRWTIALPKVAVLFIEPKYLSPEKKNKIREALQVDAAQFIEQPFLDEGPYLLGKRYARIARLILIAHQIQEYSLQKKMLKHLESLLTRKILTKSTWHFEYDTTWGGVIPSVDNYGARHYNDHHYHYGYWVYTFAVIAQFDGQWLNAPFQGKSYAPQEWIKVLIDDYANQDTKNTYFPMQRYQDDYAGHSWASGLTSFKDGQNQQSSSEAVNAYYALALYAKAVKNPDLFAWAAFLMARELKSAQTYWHIAKSSTIYSPQFTEYNQVVADLWGSKIDSNTFFTKCKTEYRCGLEYAFGIQMLPFTAISHRLIDQEWIQNAYPTLKKIILGKYGTISPQWKWLLIKGMSGFMEQKERDYYFQQAHVSSPQEYDNGDSKTNTLYFLADE